MLWADRIAGEIRNTRKPRNGKTFLIRDEKTVAGRVHVGAMRSVAVHGLVGEVLSEYGIPNEFKYEFNDFDPFDNVPAYLDQEKFKEHLGKPLYAVPSPEAGFKNYAEYFGDEFVGVHKKAGFTPNYYRATELYQSGKMDACIKTALEQASDIRRILKVVSGSEKDESWLPISIVCEKCGKMMATRANEFEGGGKDHSTKGGSRDVANHISRDVFGYEPPFDMPYEFFLVGGKKMSSSKGHGSSAKEISDLFSSPLVRLSLIGKDII